MSAQKQTILLVEDEKKISRTVKDYLMLKDYNVIISEDGSQACDIFAENNNNIDAIILDICLPKMDGYEVLKNIRQFSEVPVIMLTAKSSVEDQVNGFHSGADDYITKPFSLVVLELHLKAVLKRMNKNEEQWNKEGVVIDYSSRKIFVDENEVTVTSKEFDLMDFFVKHENVVVSRNKILDEVWGFDYSGDERTVDTMVKQLRAKLTKQHPYIKTVYGVGYRFEVSNSE